METCAACDRPAKGVVLVKASVAAVGPDLAQWTETWTCEVMHMGHHLVPQVKEQDPEALVLVLTAQDALRPGYWALAFTGEL